MAILDLATYKAYKGIKSDTEDTQHTNIINAVNTFIEAYTGRVFTTYYNTDKVEYFDSTNIELYPIEYPIQSVTSLKVSYDAGQTFDTTLVEYTDYIVDSSVERIIALNSSFASTIIPTNAIELTYQGGYLSIPKDLELVAVHLTEYYAQEDYTPRKSLAGASIDNVIQPDMTARLPAHMRRVLDNYRNISF